LSLKASKPGFYSFSEQLCYADHCPAPASFPSYSELAHPKLEVQVRYCEHRSATTRPGERRTREATKLFSASLAAVALQVRPVRRPAVLDYPA